MSLESVLSEGLHSLGLNYASAVQQRLLDYLRLLAKWNRVYNLTAVRDSREMVRRHLLDSLTVLPYLKGPRIVDVGTGAGLPGIPLAIVCPDQEFVLLDSNSKKTRFLLQVVTELGLGNVRVVHGRVEAYHPEKPYDVVLSRAFASIADMLNQAGQLCAPDGVILAMKGADPTPELNEIPAGYSVEAIHRLAVPGLDEARHVVCLHPDNKPLDNKPG